MTRMQTNKPIAVVISDIHYNINTLAVADHCLNLAVNKANSLKIPLVIAGDLHDTKANIRGECVKAVLDTLHRCHEVPYVLVGNHDKLNEKSENDSLEFIRSYNIIRKPLYEKLFDCHFIPYQHDVDDLRKILGMIPKGSRLIIHQGCHGALPGGGSFDRSALSEADYAPFTVISGHYHDHKTFKTKNGALEGRFTYVGNPFTLDFSEASHREKGFIILNEDFSFEFVPTNVRKHVVINLTVDEMNFILSKINLEQVRNSRTVSDMDKFLVKITGYQRELLKVKKSVIREILALPEDFRLDLIPSDPKAISNAVSSDSALKIFDTLVDNNETLALEDKKAIKDLWRKYMVC